VKRRRPSPLFQQIEPDVYVIDTSAWSNIDLRNDAEDVWELINGLIEDGRIVACAEVLREVHDEPFYLLRLHHHEDALKAADRSDTDYLLHVGKITREHQAMAGARGTKTKADPYVVALAELEKYVVVADESCAHRPNRKIPGVCKLRGIKYRSLEEFLTEVRATTR
jgi:Domain of unknown function (DUF4411)